MTIAPPPAAGGSLAVGDVVEVEIGPVAHGGHWVARHEGRVIFVRHALEGELVRVRVTAVTRRHAFGAAVQVLRPSPHRVPEPCPIAGDCGGCDVQHVAVPHQRELKRRVVAEQLAHLAGIAWPGEVEAPDADALGWRTRVRYHAGAGDWGLHPYRSSAVTALPAEGCRLAAPGLARPPAPPRPGEATIAGVLSEEGTGWFAPGEGVLLHQRAAGRMYAVRADGFWQVHPRAAETLVDAVLRGLAPRPGESALDLYCGVGLFAGALADAGVRVFGIEGDRDAAALAARNVPEASFLAGAVERQLRRAPASVDLVVLDPPRAGAGPRVLAEALRRRPRAVAYVACDPAALARDLATARASGWEVGSLRAFDLFGMTHHVECVAILRPGS